MLPSNTPFLTLTIIVCPDFKYLVEVIVFDAHNRIMKGEKTGEKYSYALPKGIYTIRIQISAEIVDTLVILSEDLNYYIGSNEIDAANNNAGLIKPPAVYSSAPLLDKNSKEIFKSSHEYYTGPTIDLSKRITYSHPYFNETDGSSLLLFLRFPSSDKYQELRNGWKKEFWECFDLLDEKGTMLFSLKDPHFSIIDTNTGYVAANAALPPGLYFLRCKDEEEVRIVPIYVFRNWHTQFFVMLGKKTLYGTIRIFLTRMRSFEPDNHINKLIDVLLDKLQNQDFIISDELVEQAAYGKLESPIAGLLCLYIFLKGKNTPKNDLIEQMLYNLPNAVLANNHEAPDLRALEILAASHYKRPLANANVIPGVPMLRVGFEAIIKASTDYGTLVQGYSLIDYVSENLFSDSPFVTFKEGDFLYPSKPEGKTNIFKEFIAKWDVYKDLSDKATVEEFIKDPSLPWNKPKASIIIKPLRGSNWLFRKISKLTGKGLHIDVTSVKADTTDTSDGSHVKLSREDEAGNLKNLLEGRIKWGEDQSFDVSISSMLQNGDTQKIIEFGRNKNNSSWLNVAIGDLLNQKEDMSVKEVAKELNVSPGTIVRIIDEVNTNNL